MSMKDKKFLTYNQQIKHLRDQKLIICSGVEDKKILCKSGYFNLINGYKMPFTCGKNPDDTYKYIKGTSISHFYALKEFDDDLRYLLFKYLSKVEEEIRAFAAYKFDEVNKKSGAAWFEIQAYDPNCDVSTIVALISKAYAEISRSKQMYVKFHLDSHKLIPTWVLLKIIRLATFIDFIRHSKDGVRQSLCDLYSIKNARGYNDYSLLINSLHWIRDIRNMCAHNERIYSCVRKNGRIKESYLYTLPSTYRNESDQKIFDLLIYLKYYLSPHDYGILINEVKRLLTELNGKLHPNAYDNVRASIGVKNVTHLDLLLANPKSIEYHKF